MYLKEEPESTRKMFRLLEVLEDAPSSTQRLQDSATIRGLVRPGTAGLLIDIECSRVRDRPWMYLTSFITTRIGIELAAVQMKLPDCVVVGLQLYSARTFHVTLSPRIYKGGQGPPPKTSTPKAIQTTPQNVGYYATHGPNLSKLLCCLHHRVLDFGVSPHQSST